jgi:hypothetical protein
MATNLFPAIPVQHIPLMNEDDNLYRASFNNKAGWKQNETKSYLETVTKIPNASRFAQSEFLKANNQPDDQNRKGNSHKHSLRVVEEKWNRHHPTFNHPITKPEDARLWHNDDHIQTRASLVNYNKEFVDGNFL